ncbi:MAG: phosphotransferase [Legionellales bacterium]|nr:phosphotransferase [Legionellales bacterium]
MLDLRLQEGLAWLSNQLRLPIDDVKPLAGDASFRRYFRVYLPDISYILMDVPPSHEDCRSYIAIDQQLLKSGIRAPNIVAENLTHGFLLLEDFGDCLFLKGVNSDNVDVLYKKALNTLISIQKISTISGYKLPLFDANMMIREMMLFQDWYIEAYLMRSLEPSEKELLTNTFKTIAKKIETFQYTLVHRDYHSRNLMVLKSGELGVLDFQDAVSGPLVYDALSLLKDCYVAWPRDKVLDLLGYYHSQLRANGIIHGESFTDFVMEFDWMGIQRHLKVIGIFSRLNLRDHKPAYLKDIPLSMQYLLEGLNQFEALNDFRVWLKNVTMGKVITVCKL